VTPSEPPAQTVSAGRVAWEDVPLPQFDPVPTSVERVKVDGTSGSPTLTETAPTERCGVL